MGKVYEPTKRDEDRVEDMASVGIPQGDIAAVLGISPATLRKYFRDQLDTAAVRANTVVAQRLYSAAKDGNVIAMIFWLKARAGWCDKPELLPPDQPGTGVLQLTATMSLEDWQRIAHRQQDILRGAGLTIDAVPEQVN